MMQAESYCKEVFLIVKSVTFQAGFGPGSAGKRFNGGEILPPFPYPSLAAITLSGIQSSGQCVSDGF